MHIKPLKGRFSQESIPDVLFNTDAFNVISLQVYTNILEKYSSLTDEIPLHYKSIVPISISSQKYSVLICTSVLEKYRVNTTLLQEYTNVHQCAWKV